MIRPLNGNVVIERAVAKKETAGGIILPDNAQDKPKLGKVLAVGPGAWNEAGTARKPVSVSVGASVLFTSYSGNEVELDGKTYLMMDEANILGVVE